MVEGGSASKASGEDTAPFGGRLRRLREAAGLTQEELASKAGLTARAISMLERGERKRPYPHTVRALAEALELSEGEHAVLTAAIPRRSGDVPVPVEEAAATHSFALPASLTPLLGREHEVEEIAKLLASGEVRLLTLTGPGGIGKTRLGIEAARKAEGYFPDGVAFVALAPLGDAALVMPTVSRALGLREAAGVVRPLEVLCQYLRVRKFLLVLDNFEHLAEAASEVADLLSSCPNLSVLVTSRAPLRVRGEREYLVSPLAVPDPNRTPEAEEVAEAPAVKLFIERAEDASPAFELTRANAAAVAAICWRLDGLPLALELAATKVRYLDPKTLLSRLDRTLSVGWARDLPERQRTMQATLDWSYELLHEPEKEIFRRLSIFAGGFTLEAAEDVCAGGAVEAEEVLVLVGNLAEQSLVVAETSPERTRYRMLEPVRQYALEKLRRSGEEDQVWRLHAEYYLALAEEAEPRIKGHEQVEWLDKLEAENDNLRAAIGRSLEAGDAPTAARFGWALGMYWVMRTRHGEGRLLMEQTLAQGDDELPAQMRTRALWALAVCVYGSGDNERMMAVAEEGVALSRQAGNRRGEAYALGVLGYAALQLGDLDRAERVLEESLEMVREQGDTWRAAHTMNHLTVVALNRGDYPRAAEYAEEALALTRQTGDRYAANVALSLLAQIAWASDEHECATGHWREALSLSYELANKANSASSIQGLATVAGARGELRRAARLLGAAEVLLEAAGLVLYAYTTYTSNEPHQRAASAAREELGERTWKEARDEGRAMTFEQAVEYALGETDSDVSPFV